MALNIAIDGYVYNSFGNLCDGTVSYQAYFHKTTSGSSNSKWNNTRIVESGLSAGYYNFNLGDLDMLSQDGSAAAGDEVVIVFWSPTTSDRMDACSSLTEWSIFRLILDGSSTYSKLIQVKPNICPNLNWTLTADALVQENVVANNTSTDIHQWNFNGNTMFHRNVLHSTLMTVNTVTNSTYTWGDTTQDIESGTTNGNHSYSASGDYDVELVIEDGCGCTVTGTDQIRIFNRPPVPNIVMTPVNPAPNEEVFFSFTGTDVDDTITNIAWTIEDRGSYGNTDTVSASNARDDVIPHTNGTGTQWYGVTPNMGAFTNPGSHPVNIEITWWDGFSHQTISYDETFTQGMFSGPTVNFMQDPADAELDVPVRFSNLTTNTDRVGLGLPDHFEYTWSWTDAGDLETVTNVLFTYELEKVPTSADCQVQLCAQWSDGWVTHNTCVEKDVVFGTVVTVTSEDCYYNLNIIGTSEDGSVTGYGWTVYSGTGQSGPWTETWTSPVGLEQNDKKICFTSLGWFKIEGTVYGTGPATSDDEILYVTTVCPAGDSVYNLWNGTGIQDVGSDWQHSGHGVETEEAKHAGTYGLDATGMSNNDKINFTAPGVSNIPLGDYDFLRVWVNIQELTDELDIEFKTVGSKKGDTLNFINYVDTSKIGIWQKAMVPLDDFSFPDSGETYLNSLIFTATEASGVWLDDISLTIGTVERDVIPICTPEMYGTETQERKRMRAREMKPSIKGRPATQPSARIIADGSRPFPGPTNL